jgi:4-amino-4-deoxy-L-arabinose transferase-like glycosyltransferase
MSIGVWSQLFGNIGKRPVLAGSLSILWLAVVGWIAFFWHLGDVGLIDETEPLFAEASRQMYLTGDWITPFFNGETRFDKPALIYWCQAIAYAILGVNEWAVRLPSAIAAVGVMSLVFYTVQWHLGKEDALEQVFRPQRRWLTACLSAAVTGLAPEMVVWGRTGVSDMLLTGCMASALLCFFLGYASCEEKPEARRQFLSVFPSGWYVAFYVLVAGATLTKGPVGIVLPGLIIAAFLLYLGKLSQVMREMRLASGVLIVFGLALPWYVLVIWRHGWSYINSFFGYHNLERFTEVVNGHKAPWYFYFLVVLLGFAPYSAYLPLAIARLKFWQRKYWGLKARSQQLGLFAFFWFAGVFGFFTIAVTKLPSYVLPLMPAAAILVALLWSDVFPQKDKTRLSSSFLLPLKWSGWLNVVLVLAAGIALFYAPRLIGYDPAAPEFRQILQQSGLSVLAAVIWLACAAILAVLLVRRRLLALMAVNLLGFALFMIFVLTPALFLIDTQRQLPLRELSAIAVQVQKPKEELVMVGFKKPSVVFYTRRPVNFIKSSAVAGIYLRKDAPQKGQASSVLVLAQPKKFVEIGLQPSDYQSLATSGAYALIRVPLAR